MVAWGSYPPDVFRYLVLAPPPDVPAEGELILAEVVLGEHVVELVHRQVDDVVHRDGQTQRQRLPLVPRESVPAAPAAAAAAAEAAGVHAVGRGDRGRRRSGGGNGYILAYNIERLFCINPSQKYIYMAGLTEHSPGCVNMG